MTGSVVHVISTHGERGEHPEHEQPAVHGVSVLESVVPHGGPLDLSGRDGMFQSSRVLLWQHGDNQRVVVAREGAGKVIEHYHAGGAPEAIPLGRQRVLWDAIPSLRGEIDPKKHIKAAAVVIVQDSAGAVLLTRRAATMRSYPGCWVLPGGAVDSGEDLQAAAVREIREETGLDLDPSAPLRPIAMWESAFPLTVDGYKAAGNALRAHMLVVAFAVRLGCAAPALRVEPAEVDVSVWLPADSLRALLDFRLENPHPAAACRGADGGAAAPPAAAVVAPEQLLGVYPNPQNEGLGLAHHFLLGRLLAEGQGKTVPARLKSGEQ